MKMSKLWFCLAFLLTLGFLLTLASTPALRAATIFSEDFEDGNANGWSTSGGSWSVVTDGTKAYKQSSTSATAHSYTGTASWTNYSIQARAKALSFNGSNRYFGVCARFQSSSNYYLLVLSNAGTLEIRKRSGGNFTTLATKTVTVQTGVWYTLKFDLNGSNLAGYLNGNLELTTTDASFPTGKIGFTAANASSVFDDVIVDGTNVNTPTPTVSRSPTATPTTAPTPTNSVTPSATPIASGLPVFPGAVGFGTDTPAGRGGQIIKVTNLNADGAGSLRAALAASGPRIIVFEVGGVIDLNKSRLTLNQPYVTIAGQTAPSPGITIIRGGMVITTHDVLMKHIRFRIGDAGASSGFEPDVTTDGPSAYNIVIDHCSFSWGVDENMSISGPRFDGVNGTSRRVTLSNNIIAEGLYDSIHSKGIHSMGTLVHDYCTDVAVIGNFYAHNNERNPWYKGYCTGAVVNNVIYNPGKWPIRLGAVLSEWSGYPTPEPPKVSVVGNYMKLGVNSTCAGLVGTNSAGSAYLADNIALDRSGNALPMTYGGVVVLSVKPSWPNGLVALPASQVVNQVVNHSGARPRDRDSVDTRIIAGFLAGTGQFVNSQTEVGGYPNPSMTTRALTVPTANIDEWLHSFSLALE